MEPGEREKYETNLQGDGKIFNLTENGVNSIVLYKENIIIYAHSPEGKSEIQDILEELFQNLFVKITGQEERN